MISRLKRPKYLAWTVTVELMRTRDLVCCAALLRVEHAKAHSVFVLNKSKQSSECLYINGMFESVFSPRHLFGQTEHRRGSSSYHPTSLARL
jgi:hypothetical protein